MSSPLVYGLFLLLNCNSQYFALNFTTYLRRHFSGQSVEKFTGVVIKDVQNALDSNLLFEINGKTNSNSIIRINIIFYRLEWLIESGYLVKGN